MVWRVPRLPTTKRHAQIFHHVRSIPIYLAPIFRSANLSLLTLFLHSFFISQAFSCACLYSFKCSTVPAPSISSLAKRSTCAKAARLIFEFACLNLNNLHGWLRPFLLLLSINHYRPRVQDPPRFPSDFDMNIRCP